MSGKTTEIIPYLFYDDVPAAIEWLGSAFGFSEDLRVATPSGGMHAEMSLDGARIMLGRVPPGPNPSQTMGVFVYLQDVERHYRRAVEAGAKADGPPADVSYGRTYTAHDPVGHVWYFTQR